VNDAFSLLAGGLYAAGLYLLLRRDWLRVVLGIALLGQGTFVLLFAMGRLSRAAAVFVPEGGTAPESPYMDPVPQALVLTAIVIGFAVQAFALVLFRKAFEATGEEDMDALTSTEELDA
jgi:multicomponent Na+:H+ antiporter subunit C